jgi:hypothetical protein
MSEEKLNIIFFHQPVLKKINKPEPTVLSCKALKNGSVKKKLSPDDRIGERNRRQSGFHQILKKKKLLNLQLETQGD